MKTKTFLMMTIGISISVNGAFAARAPGIVSIQNTTGYKVICLGYCNPSINNEQFTVKPLESIQLIVVNNTAKTFCSLTANEIQGGCNYKWGCNYALRTSVTNESGANCQISNQNQKNSLFIIE